MRRLIRMGVNGLMTDRPRLLRKVAIEEGVRVSVTPYQQDGSLSEGHPCSGAPDTT